MPVDHWRVYQTTDRNYLLMLTAVVERTIATKAEAAERIKKGK